MDKPLDQLEKELELLRQFVPVAVKHEHAKAHIAAMIEAGLITYEQVYVLPLKEFK